jgi:hypothetical protein
MWEGRGISMGIVRQVYVKYTACCRKNAAHMWEVARTAQTFKIRGTYLYTECMQHKYVKWAKHYSELCGKYMGKHEAKVIKVRDEIDANI